MTRKAPDVHVVRGQLRQLDMLGTVSVYEVADDPQGDVVAVRAVEVPGLDEGTVVRLTVDAVSRMRLLEFTADRQPASVTGAASYS
jgi:hypothetical protein